MNKLMSRFFKKNSKKYSNEQEAKELYVFSSIRPGSVVQTKIRPISVLSNQSSEQSNSLYEMNDVLTLFKDIDEPKLMDKIIIEKIVKLVQLDKLFLTKIRNTRSTNDRMSILHAAAKTNRSQLCAFLIDSLNIDVNIQTRSQYTPLRLLIDSSQSVNIDVCFNVLIERNANINSKDKNSSSLLHAAILKHNYSAVVLLLESEDIDLNIEDEKFRTPLHLACEIGAEQIALLLISKTSDQFLATNKNIQIKTLPIHSACSCAHIELLTVVQTILNRLASSVLLNQVLVSFNDSNKNLLECSIESNHLKLVELLLRITDLFKQPNSNGNLPVHYAARTGTPEIFNLLMEHKLISFESNLNKETPLHIAADFNRFSFIKMIMLQEKMLMVKEEEKYVPMIRRLNMKNQTPLQISLINCNEKCVEEFSSSDDVDLSVKDENNFSIYHLCVLYSNLESLRYLLNKKSNKFLDPLFIRSKLQDETPIHLACRMGQLEAIKLILIKLSNSRFSNSIESFLREKNHLGQTCFHLACSNGYLNIVEYFIKEFKITFFLEMRDDLMNTCLLNSVQADQLKICQLLIENGADLYAVNSENKNSLQISFEKKYFETSKILIRNYDREIEYFSNNHQHPLHIASFEGIDEVLKLLLDKGVSIDLLDANYDNALDIAIRRERHACIRVLLEHAHWKKLFLPVKNNKKSVLLKKNKGSHYIPNENRQMVALYDKKMWNEFEIILNKCVNKDFKEHAYNFTVLDPAKFNKMNKHPLMLITKSGQERLLMHEIMSVLLNLKWRFLPRLAFYSNILIHLVFIILFVLHSTEIIQAHHNPNQCMRFKISLIFVSSLLIVKNVSQIFLMDGPGFFFVPDNWLEIASLICTILAILTEKFSHKTTFFSIGIMVSFLNFAFLIEKLKVFGLYVLAFRRTILNSSKFIPVFLLIYMGFVLSFRTRTATHNLYFNDTTPNSMLKGLTMMLGDFKTDLMGLQDSYINYFLYLMFIIIVSIIVLNLFVGIAVGEVNTVLAEATVQQISIRIIFVLKIQFAIGYFTQRWHLLDDLLGMTFTAYKYSLDESKFSKSIDSCWEYIRAKLFKKDQGINLIDPITRLEEQLTVLYSKTDHDCKQIKKTLVSQIMDVELKFNASHQRLHDFLAEMSRKSLNNFDSTKDDSAERLEQTEKSLLRSQLIIQRNLSDLKNLTENKMNSTKQSFVQIVRNLNELTLENQIKSERSFNILDEKLDNAKELIQTADARQSGEFIVIRNNFELLDSRLKIFQVDIKRMVDMFEDLQSKQEVIEHKINLIEMSINNELTLAKLDLIMSKVDNLIDR